MARSADFRPYVPPGEAEPKRDEAYFLGLISRFGGFDSFEKFERGFKNGQNSDLLVHGVDVLIERGYPRPIPLYKVLPEGPAKQKLTFKLLEAGVIPVQSQEAKAGEKYIGEILQDREDIQDLVLSGMPPEVVGQILTVELFKDITDQEKVEELRSWTTNALLAPFIGLMEGERRRMDLTPIEMLDRIPQQVFTHPNVLKYNLVADFFQSRFLTMITELGVEGAIEEIEQSVVSAKDPDRQVFLKQILENCWEIVTRPQKGNFKQIIEVNGQSKHFPSAEQQAASYYAETAGCRLFVAPPGNGKTGAAYKYFENTDAEHIVVFAPAKGRETWGIENQVLFKDPGGVFVVNGAADLHNPELTKMKYIVIGHELLGDTVSNPALMQQLKNVLLDKVGADGEAIDEIDDFSNPKAHSTKALIELTEGIRDNYARKTGKDRNATPVLGLTATPFRTGLHDLNVPLALLYPDRFVATPAEATETKKTFSDNCLNRPDLAYLLLTGERRMFRWETASGIQEQRCDPIEVELSPFEEYLYDFVDREIGVDALNKIRLLENVLLNPLLVKAEVRHLANGKIADIDIDDVTEKLKEILLQWKVMREITEPTTEEDFLSVDKLVDLGWGDMVLNCFFSPVLENGIDTLVEAMTKNKADPQLQELGLFWQSREISSKYKALKEVVEDTLTWREGDDGILERKKLFIISPSKRQGRTSDVMQRTVVGSNGQRENLYSDFELDKVNDSKLFTLIKAWAKPFCDEEHMLLIDGSVGIGKRRDRIIDRWRYNPEDVVMLATLESIYQSRSFMVARTVDALGRRIIGLRKQFLSSPWHGQQEEQTIGRSQRQGQLIPVDNKVFVSPLTIEQGKYEAVRYTRFLYRMALAGIQLSKEDQDFFDSKRKGERILRLRERASYLRNALRTVRGVGEDGIETFLKGTAQNEEKINAQKIAEEFFDNGNDEYKISGYNAELVARIIKANGSAESNILSLGAGTLLLQRKLGWGIDNVDINSHMMDTAWGIASVYGGRKFVKKASQLDRETFQDSSYEYVDSAFALHWSSLGDVKNNSVSGSERVKILSQIHRTLKPDGKFVLTLPSGAFDDEQFERFVTSLEENFGFVVDSQYSGKSFGVNKTGLQKRIGWSIVAVKKGDINLEGLQLQNLGFSYEKTRWVKDGREQKKTRGGSDVGGDYPKPVLKLNFEYYGIIGSDDQIHYLEQIQENNLEGKNITEQSQEIEIFNGEEATNKSGVPTNNKRVTNVEEETQRWVVDRLLRQGGIGFGVASEIYEEVYAEMAEDVSQNPIANRQLMLRRAIAILETRIGKHGKKRR